jgi:hypothetical protein
MLERTDAITKEVLEPITFVVTYPTALVFKIRILRFVPGRILYVYIKVYYFWPCFRRGLTCFVGNKG